MARNEPPDPRVTRTRNDATQRINREAGSRPAGTRPTEPDVPDWRYSNRATQSVRRPSGRLPSSSDEFILWLQQGGWRILGGIFAFVVLMVILIIIFRPSEPSTASNEAQNPFAPELQNTLPEQPTVTPIVVPPTPAYVDGARFRVVGTETEGLFLRPEPNANQSPLKTLPEGTIVTIIGPDQSDGTRTWKRVRDDQGVEGWVAADFLQPE